MKGIIKTNYDNKNGFQVVYKEFDKIMREAKDKLFRSILEKDWIKIIKKRRLNSNSH